MIPRPAPITDSPLFWLMLFGSVGLVMLAAVEPKFARRQERIERMQQSRELARKTAAHSADGEKTYEHPESPFWQREQPVTLRPLMLFLAGILFVGMVVMQVRRRKTFLTYQESTIESGKRGSA